MRASRVFASVGRAPFVLLAITLLTGVFVAGLGARWAMGSAEDKRAEVRIDLTCSSNTPIVPDTYVTAMATIDGNGNVITKRADGHLPTGTVDTSGTTKATVTRLNNAIRLDATWIDANYQPHTCTDTLTLEGM